jgi:type I restriction enzyme S subunit
MAFPVPDLKEQGAIAGVLNEFDEHVASIRQLIEKKRDVARAVGHELLVGKRRLAGFVNEWTTHSLRDIGTFLKGSGIRRDQVQATGVPCVLYGEIYTQHHNLIRTFRSFVPPEVAVTSTRLRCGDLLFTGSGETRDEIGKCVAFLDDFEAVAGGDIVILRPKGPDSLFLAYLMNDPIVVKQKARLGQGDVVAHISAASLAKVDIRLPALTEQKAIGAVLLEMDTEIDILVKGLRKARAVREGIAQQLLSGGVRLVAADGLPDDAGILERPVESLGVAPALS